MIKNLGLKILCTLGPAIARGPGFERKGFAPSVLGPFPPHHFLLGGEIAYRVSPPPRRVHDVFQISQLKKCLKAIRRAPPRKLNWKLDLFGKPGKKKGDHGPRAGAGSVFARALLGNHAEEKLLGAKRGKGDPPLLGLPQTGVNSV